MFRLKFDSKIAAVQIPSGFLFGLIIVLIKRFIHLPLIPTNIPFLFALIFLIDFSHFLGLITIDISNLFQQNSTNRKLNKENVVQLLQMYFEEHLIFLICLFVSFYLNRSFLFRR